MSISIRTSIAAVVVSVLLVSLSACQGGRSQFAQKAKDRFDAADVNHDGLLRRDEARKGMPRLAEHLDEIDTDHDGGLSMLEIVAYVRQRRGSR